MRKTGPSRHDNVADSHQAGNNTAVKRRRWNTLLAVLVLWEVYWVYVYMTATIPDETMAMPAAILFGITPLILIALGGLAGLLFRKLMRQRW